MSQTTPWQAQNFPNAQGGNVQFYDPNKFQATNQSSAANNVDQVANGQSNQTGASNSWNSWGNWGDNAANANQAYSVDGASIQGQVTHQGGEQAIQNQPQGHQVGGEQQYYNQWNQGSWDPNNSQQTWDPNVQQQNWQLGSHEQAGQQGQVDQQRQVGQQGQAYWDGHQWQQPGQQWVNSFPTDGHPATEQYHPIVTSSAQPHSGVVPSTQQNQSSLSNSNTSGQFYDQISPDTSGNYSQSSASFFSNSGGLNDSTSSSLDQSSSVDHSGSSQSESSAQVAEDSMNSDCGTVAGFFGKDEGDYAVTAPVSTAESKASAVPQYLGVNPGIIRTDSAISNASLQTMNYSSQGSIVSLEDMDNKGVVQDVANQFQSVSLNESSSAAGKDGVNTQPMYEPYGTGNQNRNSGAEPVPPSVPPSGEEEEQQSSNLNDWEIVPDQPTQGNAGVNFYIGSNQDQVNSFSNAGQDSVPPQVAISSGTAQGSAALSSSAPPPSVPGAGPAASPLPPQLGSQGGPNPFRKASPHNVRRNLSNQSLPSLPGDAASPGSPVIFSPGTQINPGASNAGTGTGSAVSSEGSIPRPVLSNVAKTDTSAFKPPVPTETSETAAVVKSEVTSAVPSVTSAPSVKREPGVSVKEERKDSKDVAPDKSPESKPPVAPGSRQAPVSPRKHASAFHPVSHRAKHSMSPATTLWDNIDAPATNIILAPAAPVLSASNTPATTETGVKSPLPVIPIQASLESRLKDTKGNDKNTKSGRDSQDGNVGRDSRGGSDRGGKRREDENRKKDDDNRSINSLDELDAQIDYRDQDDYRDRRYRDKYGYRDYRDPRYEYDRPPSRTDAYRDYGRRRDPYRSRDPRDPYSRDPYYEERYDRPRSRQEDDRPGSRSGQDSERMRGDYERDPYARERDRYRTSGYGYDYYGNHQSSRYYDDHDRYGNYYRDTRYSRGYYEEMGYYGQGYSNRYSDYYGSQYGGTADAEYDRYSHHSLSRGHTPALDDNASGDYYQRNNGSRSSSRQDIDEAHAYARHGYDYDYGYDNYAYNYDYDPNYGYYYRDSYHQEPQGRMTPQKHTIPHVRASFGANGQLIKVLPNRPADGQPATVEVHSLEEMMADNTEAEELKTFPGPLTRADTHKNDVLQFCQQKAQQCAENINMVDRDSAELIWRLMELIIKQNGSVVGTDIADLLLEGHQPTSLEYSMMGMKITQSSEELDKIAEDEATGVKVTSDRSQINKGRSLEEVTDRFRNLLLYGRKKDALEWATKNNLWGHALFLASKMDTRTHANVMIRFANSAMKMNDPLQTLYQLMSGRQPAAVTCVVDERWGDWRPHLAMILSNSSSKPDLDRKSIAALGDTMASKGCLHASHFCYIMAQANFGTFAKKTSKIVLIGSSHNSSWEEFATNEAIQCTEIYEYAQSLGNQSFVLPHFQVYKFLYATRLAEYGFLQEALHYCEVISSHVQSSPAWFQPAFVKILYELSNRLKYHDPQRVHAADEAEDPAWLQQLQRVCLGYDDGSIQPLSGNATPAMFGGTTTSSESGDINYTNGAGQGEYSYQQYGQEQSYQQFSQETAYQPYGQNQVYQQQQAAVQYAQQSTEGGAQTGQEQTKHLPGIQESQSTEQQNQWANQYNYNYGYQTGGQGQQQVGTDVPDAAQHTDSQTMYGNQSYSAQGYNQQQYNSGYGQDYMGSDRLASQRGSVVSSHSVDTEGSQTDGRQEVSDIPASSFDYFGAATTHGKIVAPASRYRTTSGSSSTGGSIGRQRTLSESSTGSVKVAPSMKKSHTDSSVAKKANISDKDQKKKGWFEGWFSKKKKTEMHLPKDDKQAIVWDPVRKRWKNTEEGEEEDDKPAMPPPKDTDLGGNLSSGSVPAAPSAAAGSMGAPPSGNRFSLQKGRGARNQYVDVLSTKTTPAASVPSNLFNVLPSTTLATNTSAQIFNPSGSGSSEPSSQQTAPSGGQTSGGQTLEPPAGDLSRSSSMSSLSREVQQLTNQSDAGPAPVTNPIMFNPAQFPAAQFPATQSSASKGPKYGQRRQYPK